ncbi:MAG: hypothetical protein ACUVV0_00450 [Anaerolineae bacterium]
MKVCMFIDLREVERLGLKHLRIQKALEEYRRGGCSLAYAAQQAGISIREMIPLAYANGIEPRFDPAWLEMEPSLEQATRL